MRPSERWTIVAVGVMTAPAVLAFPVVGLWYVAKVWPGMGSVDRGLFCSTLLTFCGGLTYLFHRGMRRIGQGGDGGTTPLEEFVLAAPVLVGGWALTHQVGMLLSMTLWFLLGLYRAHRRHSKVTVPRKS